MHDDGGNWIDDEVWEAAKEDERGWTLGEAEEPQDALVFDREHTTPRARLSPEEMYEQGYVWIHNTWFETDEATFVGFAVINAPKPIGG